MESVASTKLDAGAAAYEMTPGSQVRAEKTGLLFYKRQGPRLYLLSCGDRISPDFFSSGQTLKEWLTAKNVSIATLEALERALAGLEAKGVVRVSRRGP